MFIAIWIISSGYIMWRLFSTTTKTNSIPAPKIQGEIKIRHTIIPDNPESNENEWHRYIHDSLRNLKN